MTDYSHARRAMVDNQLRTSGITDRRLLAAMGAVAREDFVPETRRSLAYVDVSHILPGPAGRALAAPAPFARLVQLAGIGPGDRILDIGTGYGYSSAVLGRLGREVVALESDAELAKVAREALAAAGASNARVEHAPLETGAPELAPYDVIILEGTVAAVPEALLNQLSDGGRLAALVSTNVAPVAHLFLRSGADVASRRAFNASMPPLVRERPPESFVF